MSVNGETWPETHARIREAARQQEADPAQELKDLEKRAQLVRSLHSYGPIINDEGDRIGFGCVTDGDDWPCATLIALGVDPALARQHLLLTERHSSP